MPAVQYGQPKRRNWWLIGIGAVVVSVIAGLVVGKLMGVAATQPRDDRYQVVFLNNDQVFFGKLKNTTGEYLRLEQAYQTRQSEVPENATEEQKKATNSNLSLVKVGSLVYGPENVLMIRADNVIFWQDLSDDSKVTRAIEDAE
jgi:hypothetical protein